MIQTEQPCGHPFGVLNRSVETGVAFCSMCRLNEMLSDALASEAALRDELRMAADCCGSDGETACGECNACLRVALDFAPMVEAARLVMRFASSHGELGSEREVVWTTREFVSAWQQSYHEDMARELLAWARKVVAP